jgi:hypothetical protein
MAPKKSGKIKQIKICPTPSYKYFLMVWAHFTYILSHFNSFLHSTQCQTIGVQICKCGVTFSTSWLCKLLPLSMSDRMGKEEVTRPIGWDRAKTVVWKGKSNEGSNSQSESFSTAGRGWGWRVERICVIILIYLCCNFN